ncbi:histidine kinase N-terminal domain-containing protein [Peribacillus deserti]|uniref:histidine kinase n=1 Tax=Peribacillus deserti TaxID=673318 RepID=A0A2N5M7X3_9BACI|nr:histidine kinase N-terminal domain-containing protein [Peribacillus deserti]PLT30447.1 histidine kinase [Peribacillus deserti]
MFSSLQSSHKKILVCFLEEQEAKIMKDWHDSIIIDKVDPHKELILENGFSMFNIIKHAITGSLSEKEMINLAHKVALERLEANINIGDFVYNVNLGRSIIIKHIFQSNIPAKDMQSIINHMNSHFDLFCYHAVSQYTNLKNKELNDKTLYISENHKDKLAVLGQISSSFVHEFRNPLTSIMGFTKILKNDHPNLLYLDIIEHELNQLNFRITQFLHTSKAGMDGKQEAISIKTLFNDIQQLSYPSIVDTDVNVQLEIGADLEIRTNRDELKQVLLNLFINSIDALKQKEKPRNLLVKCWGDPNALVITLSNNGPAIAPENIKTIFEPFFTTKELGTGIGLYVCKKIIEKHGGYIKCDSNDDLTTFSVFLPMSGKPVS